MDPARIREIRISFDRYRESRTLKRKLRDFLTHLSPVAGTWWEKGKTATVYTDQHKTLEEVSRTLAHELGHALDHAVASYDRPVIWIMRLYLILLGAGSIAVFGWNPVSGGNVPLIVAAAVSILSWLEFAIVLTLGTSLLTTRIYRQAPEEISARDWEEKLISREDWSGVLSLIEPSGS